MSREVEADQGRSTGDQQQLAERGVYVGVSDGHDDRSEWRQTASVQRSSARLRRVSSTAATFRCSTLRLGLMSVFGFGSTPHQVRVRTLVLRAGGFRTPEGAFSGVNTRAWTYAQPLWSLSLPEGGEAPAASRTFPPAVAPAIRANEPRPTPVL